MWPFGPGKAKRKRLQAEAEAAFERLKEEDAAEAAEADAWLPPVVDGEFEGGRFVRYKDVLLRADMIECIALQSKGTGPHLFPDWGDSYDTAWPGEPAVIAITLTTGRAHEVRVNRHKAPHLLAALRDAWMGDGQPA